MKMDCNKDEAIRAKEIAEKKMQMNDFEGALKVATKAKNLDPELDDISRVLCICDVHCSAQSRKFGYEKDWYGILQVEKLADEATVKKQYRRLALTLHPDKNRFPGAEAAFKLICEANSVLSDPSKKSMYDNKVKLLMRHADNSASNTMMGNSLYGKQNQIHRKVPPNGFSGLNQSTTTQPASSMQQQPFWTSCPFCSAKYQYLRQYVNRILRCQNCTKNFMGCEIKAVPNQRNVKYSVVGDAKNVSAGAGSSGVNGSEKAQTVPGAQKPKRRRVKTPKKVSDDSKGSNSWKSGETPVVDSNGNADGLNLPRKEDIVGEEKRPDDISDIKSDSSPGNVRRSSRNKPCNLGDEQIRKTPLKSSSSGLEKNENQQEDALNQSSQPASSAQPEEPASCAQLVVFWTFCTFCGVKYKYERRYLNRNLRCQTCGKNFIGHEIDVGDVPVGKGKINILSNSKSCSTQSGSHQEEAVGKKKDVKDGSDGRKNKRRSKVVVATKITVVSDVSEPDICKTSKKEGEIVNGNTNVARTPEASPNKSRKNVQTPLVNSNDNGDGTTDVKSDCSPESTRRSSRKRPHVSYNIGGEGTRKSLLKRSRTASEKDEGQQKDAMKEDSNHVNGSSKEAEAVKSDETPPVKDTSGYTDGKANEYPSGNDDLGEDEFACPDPEFNDFDIQRDESRFQINQFWACYDTLDHMPRFYALVKKVRASPFELQITWLEAVPYHKKYDKWVDKELPVGCGSFRLGDTDKTSARLTFSHLMHFEKGTKKGSFVTYPREGEVWALFKDWDVSWSSNPSNPTDFKYEMVEVLSNFNPGVGIKVSYLEKVSGFVSLFERASGGGSDGFLVKPDDIYKFSHKVPFFKMKGSERRGVPVGALELDPASLPLNPNNLPPLSMKI